MKKSKTLANSLLAGLAVLSLSMAGVAQAGPNTLTRGPNGAAYIPNMEASFPAMAAKYGMDVSPFNLVFLAFHGFFASEGIPSSQSLEQAYRNGKVAPEALVQAAIKMNRLPSTSLKDKVYLDKVRTQLDDLTRPN